MKEDPTFEDEKKNHLIFFLNLKFLFFGLEMGVLKCFLRNIGKESCRIKVSWRIISAQFFPSNSRFLYGKTILWRCEGASSNQQNKIKSQNIRKKEHQK
jgi:hypothetical protein